MKFTGKASAVPLKSYTGGVKNKDTKANINLIDYAKGNDEDDDSEQDFQEGRE